MYVWSSGRSKTSESENTFACSISEPRPKQDYVLSLRASAPKATQRPLIARYVNLSWFLMLSDHLHRAITLSRAKAFIGTLFVPMHEIKRYSFYINLPLGDV